MVRDYWTIRIFFVGRDEIVGVIESGRQELQCKRWSERPPPHGVTVRQAIYARGVRSRVEESVMRAGPRGLDRDRDLISGIF